MSMKVNNKIFFQLVYFILLPLQLMVGMLFIWEDTYQAINYEKEQTENIRSTFIPGNAICSLHLRNRYYKQKENQLHFNKCYALSFDQFSIANYHEGKLGKYLPDQFLDSLMNPNLFSSPLHSYSKEKPAIRISSFA